MSTPERRQRTLDEERARLDQRTTISDAKRLVGDFVTALIQTAHDGGPDAARMELAAKRKMVDDALARTETARASLLDRDAASAAERRDISELDAVRRGDVDIVCAMTPAPEVPAAQRATQTAAYATLCADVRALLSPR